MLNFCKLLAPFLAFTALSALAASAPRPDPPGWFEADSASSQWTARGSFPAADLSIGGIRLVGHSGQTVNVRFIGGSHSAAIRGEQDLGARSYYFRGRDPQKWRTAVPHFKKVRAEGVYPGIDALYYVGPHGLEADFIVSAGADLTRLALQFENRWITVDAQGNLRDKASGELLLSAPLAYEVGEKDGLKLVPSRFRLLASNRAGFQVERADPSRPLVIDPVLSFATFLGGSGRDTLVAIERGPDGRIYVAGNTTSVDLPGAVSLNFSGELIRPVVLPSEDTFVACYSADGSTLLYTVYVGGSAQDLATSLAVDSQGRPTVVGYTHSTNFPVTPNIPRQYAYQYFDAFAFRLTADGSAMDYSVFLNVISPSYGYLAANNPLTFLVGVDASGAATIGGPVPTFNGNNEIGVAPTAGAFQIKAAGGNDIFLMRLTPNGLGVQWATYYGGTHDESLLGMAVDPAGNVILVGTTTSNDLPLMRPFQAAPPTVYSSVSFSYSAATAGFFARFAPNGGSITSASYFGGQSKNSSLNSVALDDTGAIYLGGSSAASATPGLTEIPGQPSVYASNQPAAILKLDATGSTPQFMWAYSALTAGAVRRIRVDASHHPCILTNFGQAPTTPGALPINIGYPGFGFACFGNDGETVEFATMPPGGGTGPTPADFAIASDGTLFGASTMFGATSGTPPTTANAPQPAPGGGNANGYVFAIRPDNPVPQLFLVTPPLIFPPTTNTGLTNLSLLGANFASGATVLWNGAPVTFSNLGASYTSSSISAGLSAATLAKLPKGDAQIQVSMPGPGGGTSSAVTIKYLNPVPAVTSITPSAVPAGSGATTFTVIGTLTPDASITVNGASQTIVPGPSSGFQFTLPASAFSTAGDIAVVASNPAPGGGSTTVHVSVTPSGLPFPSINSPVIVGIGQGGTPQNLTVNFVPDDAIVVWNGSDRPTSRINSTTLQYVLSLNDVQQMGSASFQIRSGGVLGQPVTAFIGFPGANRFVWGDADRGLAYFAAGANAQVLEAVALPAGTVFQTLDLGAPIQSLSATDDKAYFWVTTNDGRINRVNIDGFSIDITATVPAAQASNSYSSTLAAIPVAGSSTTIIASGTDGVLRILDAGHQRGFSTADLFPAPSALMPVFATPDAVWARTLNNSINSTCLVRLPYDYTGFESFATSCENGLDLSAEVKLDAGVVYFQSGSDSIVWSSPRGGYVDFSRRRIVAPSGSKVVTYDMDSEALTGTVPQTGALPFGTLVPYSGSQALLGVSNMLLLIDLPQDPSQRALRNDRSGVLASRKSGF